ncbi:hypothetical protein CZ674_00860 [Agrococcus casei LMG 22410]|uniref:Uncharacterized protein n=1 Tax=Agrococcus casei LMG 22410 TaxID=1255656 RepID=A0A1R4ETS3_9MICO|nr:hypothetical protein CZ674_00860 [Agrococcus casei LMG 22410]
MLWVLWGQKIPVPALVDDSVRGGELCVFDVPVCLSEHAL